MLGNMVARTNFKHIGLLVYGRFPTEKAYGGHVFEIAKSFTELGIKTTVFFSKTNNKKRLLSLFCLPITLKIPKN